jgi:hypothetical protein
VRNTLINLSDVVGSGIVKAEFSDAGARTIVVGESKRAQRHLKDEAAMAA